jgi:hypothetical protein
MITSITTSTVTFDHHLPASTHPDLKAIDRGLGLGEMGEQSMAMFSICNNRSSIPPSGNSV